MIESIEEGKKHEFHDLNLKNFLGKKLSTTATSTAIVSDKTEEMPVLSDDVIKKYIDHEEEINNKLNPKISCPELVGTNLITDAACTNDKCGKHVATVPVERIVTCMSCNSTVRVKNVSESSVVCYYLKAFRYRYPQMQGLSIFKKMS